MKTNKITNRPSHTLMKQSDVVSYYHLQFPRWLLEDSRYMNISVEAKFTYMLLFNRFQLSKHNGWINDNGEVFVIYTRKELAAKLNVCEKKASGAFWELKDIGLIWERRCGRGFANQIYLVMIEVSLKDALNSAHGPLDPKTEDYAVLDSDDGEIISDDETPESMELIDIPATTQNKEQPNIPFKNHKSGCSKTADYSVQEPPILPPNKKELKFLDNNYNQYQSCQVRPDMNTELMEIFIKAETDYLADDEKEVIENAIERLYFSQSIKLRNTEFPNSRIRYHLVRLNYFMVQDALCRLGQNTNRIRDSSAYTATVLFSAIIEHNSTLLVDPYLNQMRAASGNKPNLEVV